jgi:hypothetical protein
MNPFASRLPLLALFVVAVGCKSSDAEDHDLGTAMVGTYSVHVLQEGTFGPGTTTKYAIQPTPGKPDKIECWFGSETTTPHVTGNFDPNDSDYDCLVPTPATIQPTDKLWFGLTTGTTTANGSVATSP